MISAVEQRFYQGVVDNLENEEWIPDIYYTVVPGSKIATHDISKELIEAVQPFLGEVMDESTQNAIQSAVDQVVDARTRQREILIWTTLLGEPTFIERLHIVRDSNSSYRIAPYLDRSRIMQDILGKMEELFATEKENGTSFRE